MPIIWQNQSRIRRNILLLLALLSAGCAALDQGDSQPQSSATYQTESNSAKSTSTGIMPVVGLSLSPASLTLSDLLQLAADQNPDLAIARAQASAARGRLVQAGLYPNPIIAPEIDNVGARGNSAGEPGINFFQEIVTAGKLKLDQAAAAHGVSAAEWQATTQWYIVATKIRKAYVEVLAAGLEKQAAQEILSVAEKSLAAARKLLKAGVGNRPDVLRAEVERDQANLKLVVANRRVFAAAKLLAAAVGVPELPCEELQGSLDTSVPIYEWRPLRDYVLTHSSEIRDAEAKVLQAEQILARAQVEPIPNVTLHLRPSYFLPDDTTLFFARASVPIPVFNHNEGNIHAAAANLAQARAAVGKVQMRLTEQLTNAFQQYQVALKQTESFQNRILKNARDSVKLVQFGYEKGDPKYDYTALLQAQQTLFQAELANVLALGGLWQAVVELEGLLQTSPIPSDHPAH